MGSFFVMIYIIYIMHIEEDDMDIPEWALRLKGRGQAIQKRGGCYYLYDVKYGYDRETKRSKTKSKTYVGRLDEKLGIIRPERKVSLSDIKDSLGSPLEYEATNLLETLGRDIREALVTEFGEEDGNAIMAMGKIGLIEKSPEKRIRISYESSYESVRHPGLSLSPSSVSRMTERIGRSRDAQLRFMKRFVCGSTHLIFDGTRLVCYARDNSLAGIGYNHSQIWDPQVNLMYCFSLRPMKMPVYFMPFAGNKPDVSNIMTCVRELGLKDVFLICDKGFRDIGNLEELKESGIVFLTPLKRNSSEIDYSFMEESGGLSAFGTDVFLYHGRPIYYHVCQKFKYEKTEIKTRGRHPKGYVPRYRTVQKDLTILFRDVSLMDDEFSSYSVMMAEGREGYNAEGLKANEKYFGTIALSVNRDMTPQELFETYKERELIEDGNKAYKDVLGNFASHKQGTDAYKGWLFVNHISLMLYYRVLGKIKEKGLSSKYSVEDVIDVAKRITVQAIGGEWNENVPALSDMKAYREVMQ